MVVRRQRVNSNQSLSILAAKSRSEVIHKCVILDRWIKISPYWRCKTFEFIPEEYVPYRISSCHHPAIAFNPRTDFSRVFIRSSVKSHKHMKYRAKDIICGRLVSAALNYSRTVQRATVGGRMKWGVGARVFTYVGVHKASCPVLLGDQLHASSYCYCMNRNEPPSLRIPQHFRKVSFKLVVSLLPRNWRG